MTLTIQNYMGTTDSFAFPYNSQSFDDVVTSNHTFTPIGFYNHGILVSGRDGALQNNIILTGHFSGTSKWTNFRLLSKHFRQTTRLKKLLFESDKFYLGVGKQVKKTHSSGRTNFIDYVASFDTVMAILFSTTEKTSGTNGGNIDTFVTRIHGTYDGTGEVTLKDNEGNTMTIPATEFSGTEKVLYEMVRMTHSGKGIYVSEYGVCSLEADSGTTTTTTSNKLVDTSGTPDFSSTVNVGDIVHNTTDDTFTTVTAVDDNSTLSLDDDIMATSETYVIYHVTNNVTATAGLGLLKIRPGANITTITTTNMTSVSTYTRDGYGD